jgi:signal transduction histidine kinase
MKLFARYSRINLTATLLIFLVASVSFYFTLRFIFINQIDQDLTIEEKEIRGYVQEHDQLPESISVKDQLISYQPAVEEVQRQFSTQQFLARTEKEREDFRQLAFSIRAAGQLYTVRVSKSLEDTENLNRSVLLIAFATIIAILLVTFIMNRVFFKKIWNPFYQSLEAVQQFKVGGNAPMQLAVSNIDEFQLMNKILKKITEQAQLDYLSLKTFSENASHEIQTPLAVIRSKLDLMMQDEQLTQKQSEAIQAAYNSVQRLTKLNQSLLLLAKIENNQFHEIKPINLKKR